MKEHGYYKVWDCGHLKYELEILNNRNNSTKIKGVFHMLN